MSKDGTAYASPKASVSTSMIFCFPPTIQICAMSYFCLIINSTFIARQSSGGEVEKTKFYFNLYID